MVNSKINAKAKTYKADDEIASELSSTESPFINKQDFDNKTNVTFPEKSEKIQGDSIAMKQLEAGSVGKYIGTGDSASKNIVCILLVLLVIIYFILIMTNSPHLDDYGRFSSSIITLSLGYLFGKSVNTKQ